MSNDIKISRELAQRWLDDMGPEKHETAPSLKRKREELRALLAADPVPPLIQTLHANGDSIAMEATIAQQAQRIADLERGRGEPVAVIRKVVTDTSTGYEGVVLATAIISGLVDDGTKLYTSPPAPVAVVLPERLTSAELEELEVIEVLLHGQRLSNLAGTMAAARQFIDEIAYSAASTSRTVVLPERKPIEALEFNWTTEDVENTGWNACLDKVKELNQ